MPFSDLSAPWLSRCFSHVGGGGDPARESTVKRWTSPTYGFSVSWAGTEWQPRSGGNADRRRSGATRSNSSGQRRQLPLFRGGHALPGNLSSCVAEEANLLAQETGVSDIRPYRDQEGVEFVADGPNSSAAAFTLTLSIGGQEVELVDYVECRTLIPGQAVLIITLVTEPSVFDQELAAAQTVIDTVVLSEEPPLDPLPAYGGWLAAAQERPSVAGPLSGEFAFGPGSLGVERAGVDAPDFYARAEFANPEPRGRCGTSASASAIAAAKSSSGWSSMPREPGSSRMGSAR